MSNRLVNETSPYLLMHKDNPVDWYPWCEEAFERARTEDKPVFLSIGYSACHWCHVIAHESFEDEEIAALLNRYFICIKVDKEERPDIDSVYMSVCQAFTGGGGWPTSIFMTAEQKPFFAGTYFPRTSKGGMIGLRELLITIQEKWLHDRDSLLQSAEEIIKQLGRSEAADAAADIELAHSAVALFERMYDKINGGFGRAPKFPTPHNLIFLLCYFERYKNDACLKMAEHTLVQMYRGGMFDHIGYGFCRYSTDRRFLVPHFEKMLYDNALLILAYCKAYELTKKSLYLDIAKKTADYVLREMTSPEGGFYSSQDADIDGEEGKYYLFTPNEIIDILGRERGEGFNRHFDITAGGNFEGRNIPNLLKGDYSDKSHDEFLPAIYDYRKRRHSLKRDEKILTSWNGLMIGAMCELYLKSADKAYLSAAERADRFISEHLCNDDTLFVSYHSGKRGARGFLDDYAGYIFAQLSLYRATLDNKYIDKAVYYSDKVIADFGDDGHGFYLYGKHHESLILRPKETYDGAIPSGNSMMAYNLVRLAHLTDKEKYHKSIAELMDHMARDAARYPAGYSMFLISLLEYNEPPIRITAVLDGRTDKKALPLTLPANATVILLEHPTAEYSLKNGETTYYVCKNNSCLPPTNSLNEPV